MKSRTAISIGLFGMLLVGVPHGFAANHALLSRKVPPKVAHSDAVTGIELGAASKHDIKDVKLLENVKLDVGGKPLALMRVTSGLRQKKVALFWFSVYVNQVFTNSKADFSSLDQFRKSLMNGLPVVVTMTFVRDIPIDKIVDGYREVFEENGVDPKAPVYAEFLNAIQKSGDVKDRQTYSFAFTRDSAGKNRFSFWTNQHEFYSLNDVKTADLENFFSMWYAKPSDSGLEQLQEQILKHETNQ